jgi:predicted ribosomally synthesized peptide with SipW-like signal peptide
MKGKLLAIVMVAIVSGALVTGGSIFAYFSDVESVDGNQYTSGTLNLNLGGAGTIPANIGPVYPGWGTTQYPNSAGTTTTITVSNTGNINGVLWLNFTAVTNNDNGISDPESKYNLVPGDGGDTTNGIGNGELQLYLYVSVSYNSNQVYGPVVLNNIGSAGILIGGLSAGASQFVTITYYVPTTVGNVIQSDSVGFNLVFNLEQNRMAAV